MYCVSNKFVVFLACVLCFQFVCVVFLVFVLCFALMGYGSFRLKFNFDVLGIPANDL